MISSSQVVPCICRYEHLVDHFAVQLQDMSGDNVNICVPTERQAEELNDQFEVLQSRIEEVWLNNTEENDPDGEDDNDADYF